MSVYFVGLERWGKGNTSAMCQAVRKHSGKLRYSERTSGCTLERGPLSATGFSVGNVLLAVMSCRGMQEHTQVLQTLKRTKILKYSKGEILTTDQNRFNF